MLQTAEKRASMSSETFVLVHGAWRGGWCYSRLARLLRSDGHDVFTPTLTGLGERAHLLSPQVNLSVHVDDILNLFKFEQLTDVVLCGHSYGGLVITAVADAIPERIKALVYVDANLGGDRKSVFDLDTPEAVAFFVNQVQDNGGHVLPPLPANRFNVSAANEAWVDRLCSAQPFATFVERRPLTGKYHSVLDKTYLLATNWARSPFHRQCASIDGKPGWKVHKIDCGHDVMIDQPAAVAALLQSRRHDHVG